MAAAAKRVGHLYFWDDERAELASERGTFTDVFPVGVLAAKQLALICGFDDGVERLDALGILVRGHQVASLSRVARFDSLKFLDAPVELSIIQGAAELGEEGLVRSALSGGLIGPKALLAACRAIVNVRPSLVDDIADLLALLDADQTPAGDGDVAAFERDAVGVALDLAGMSAERAGRLASWRPQTQRAPFLEGLGGRVSTEDQMIANDLRVFGNWAEFDDGDPLAVRFTSGAKTVTIANVNRTRVESSTGADLIYYSHDWESYVLVQYKRMVRETGMGWVFRPSLAGRLDPELDRLRQLPAGTPPGVAATYRLSDEPAYLKLCRQMNADIGSRKLAAGIYLPVSFYDAMVADPEAVGPKGGRRLVLADLRERWLSGETFIDLVRRGFIGSRGLSTAALTEQIRDALDSGRSVTLAAGGTRAAARNVPFND